MMIRVRLYAGLREQVAEAVRASAPVERRGAPLEVSLPAGSRVADLLAHLGLPTERARIIFVNGISRDTDHILGPGDEVGIFPAIGGG